MNANQLRLVHRRRPSQPFPTDHLTVARARRTSLAEVECLSKFKVQKYITGSLRFWIKATRLQYPGQLMIVTCFILPSREAGRPQCWQTGGLNVLGRQLRGARISSFVIILINCIIILILIIREELYSHDETEELNGLESGQGSGPQRKKGNYGALKFEA